MYQFTQQRADDLHRQRLADAGKRRLITISRATRHRERAERRVGSVVRRAWRLRAPARA